MAVTTLPYVAGHAMAGARPALGWFSGFTFNVADSCVYLSWIRQAAEGHILQGNLFTTESQRGWPVNVFFVALGTVARVTHLPLSAIYHLARIVSGLTFLRIVWWLLGLLLVSERARRAAFLVICLSAGLGWVPGLWERGSTGPVDVWQPESVTFLSLYMFPLFLVALSLMLGFIGWLWVAEHRRSTRHAVYAGLCGLLLGNVHTYDVITVTAIWWGYLVVRATIDRRIEAASWGRALIASGLAALSTGYTAYLVAVEPVFARRMAVPTASPSAGWYLLGYGLVLALAVAGAFVPADVEVFRYRSPGPRATRNPRLLLVVWAVVNLGVAYLPLPFQRKMIMGEHVALGILAGIGLCWLAGLISAPMEGHVGTRSVRYAVLFGAALLLPLTNIRVLGRDVESLTRNEPPVRSFLYAGEVSALDWISRHAPDGAPVQPLPWIVPGPDGRAAFFDYSVACFTPALTGHPVNAGHWGETPDFFDAMRRWARFMEPGAPEASRLAQLRGSGVQYVLFSQKRDESHEGATERALLATFRERRPRFLRLIDEASNADADVYMVEITPETTR